jgi:Flp pilus assembly protein CpaB
MTVAVNDVVGISGFIMPGTLVDVVVVIDLSRVTVRSRVQFQDRFAEHQGTREWSEHRQA